MILSYPSVSTELLNLAMVAEDSEDRYVKKKAIGGGRAKELFN